MKTAVLFPLIALLSGAQMLCAADASSSSSPSSSAQQFGNAAPLEWSKRMADSEMAREGDKLFYKPDSKEPWNYTSGLFAIALIKLGEYTGEPRYIDFAKNVIGTFIEPDGSIKTYKIEIYSLDNVQSGWAALELYRLTGDERYRWAADRLRSQLSAHPRTNEGGFWHKLRYAHQMWLDGIYMGEPFYADYALSFGDRAAFDDIAKQFRLIAEHTFDPKTGLFYHAWDESKSALWANKETGDSASFWGRAIGWYAMAFVDVLDYFPKDHPKRAELISWFQKLASALAKYQDQKSGLWWQVVDQGSREGNYLEASASSMFVYALAKGVNNGYLPREKYEPIARAGYAGLIRDLVKTDPDGRVNLTQVCKVAGLDERESKQHRDGSFDYYTKREPIVANDLKGVGPFILAGIEIDRLLRGGSSGSAK